jgi:uncharacterized protein YndB with AHSA1/START domain
MGTTIASSTTIARPVEDVFQYLLDLDQHPSEGGVDSVVKSPAGPTAPGTTFRFTHANGRETSTRFTVVEPHRTIGFEGRVGPLRPVGDFTFARHDGRTRLTVRVAPNPSGPVRLLSPLVTLIGRRVWNRRLASIKTALEGPPYS